MSRQPILDLCARIDGHQEQYKKLRGLCENFKNWDELVHRAENEGMTPLLHRHLEEANIVYPKDIRRMLILLLRRHQHNAKVRIKTLKEILATFQKNELTTLLIKGAALCHTLYPDPYLRPMRDMDFLMGKEEALRAQKILQEMGFITSQSPIPSDHFHLPALLKTVDGVSVCIEIHTDLYPDCPPYYPEVNFEKMLEGAYEFEIEGVTALTLGNHDTLLYIFQHGFRMPLTYEAFKLINGADVISFTERKYSTINWEQIKEQYPILYKALPLFHHLTPWDLKKLPKQFIPKCELCKQRQIIDFTGWPKTKFKDQKLQGRSFYQIISTTFVPPSWWFRLYYGLVTRRAYLRCIFFTHPRHILWWVKLYSSFLSKDKSLIQRVVSLFNKMKS